MTLPDSAIVLQRGEGDSVAIGTGTRCTFKVRGKDTEGHFGLFEYVMEPGTEGPRRHIHRQMAEIFYVVEGAIELLVGDEKMTAQARNDCPRPQGSDTRLFQPRRATLRIVDHVLSGRLAREILRGPGRTDQRRETA